MAQAVGRVVLKSFGMKASCSFTSRVRVNSHHIWTPSIRATARAPESLPDPAIKLRRRKKEENTKREKNSKRRKKGKKKGKIRREKRCEKRRKKEKKQKEKKEKQIRKTKKERKRKKQ